MNKTQTLLIIGSLAGMALCVDESGKMSRAPRAEKKKESHKPTDITGVQANNEVGATLDGEPRAVTPEEVIEFLRASLNSDRSHQSRTIYIYPSDIGADGYVITKPGQYVVHETLYNTATAGAAISIQANNVTLDFNYYALYQTTSDPVDGVHIAKGVQHVEVKNGTLYGLGGAGIVMHAGVRDSSIRNMTIRNCLGDGISYKGEQAVISSDIRVINSEIRGNGGSGGRFFYVDQVKIINSLFNNNHLHGLVMEHGHSHEVRSCVFCNNQGDRAVSGLSLFNIDSSLVSGCAANANRAVGCASGFMIDGDNNKIEHCEATANDAESALGFELNGSRHSIVRCRAHGNGLKEQGTGFLVQPTAHKCCVQYCTSTVNAHSGFKSLATYGANLFMGNFSFGHGQGNYVGAGIGSIIVGVAAQRTALEESSNNISVI